MIYIIYIYKQDLALNNLQGLICHKSQLTNQPTKNCDYFCTNQILPLGKNIEPTLLENVHKVLEAVNKLVTNKMQNIF